MIDVAFTDESSITIDAINQWTTGNMLKVTGLSLNDKFTVTYSHSAMSCDDFSIDRLGRTYSSISVVPIPNRLFTEAGIITVLFCGKSVVVTVAEADKPTDYDSNYKCDTDTDACMISELIANGSNSPVGTIVITSTNEAPSSFGAWELIDKEFKPQAVTGSFSRNTTNCTSCSVTADIAGHSMYLKFTHVNKTSIGDTALAQGTLNPSSLGVSEFPITQNGVMGQSDGGNAITMWNMSTAGVLQSIDRDAAGSSMAAGNTTYIYMNYVVDDYTTMDDSFCNKFYWERTA